MLRTKVDAQQTLWEAILPPELLRLPPGLEQVDRLLDDPVFFEPFVPFFHPVIGRPSIPMETYLRMMFLRFRYRLGFETLCAEVTDSLAWRRFCRIGITDAVPHPTTLMKITTRCGEQAVDQLNEALLRKANAAHVVKLDRVRADTTVVPANVSYPTDSGLLSKGVAKLTKTVRAIQALGLARRTRFRDRTRSVRRRAHQVAVWLRRRSGDAKDEVLELTGELARIADAAIKDAHFVATNARRALLRAGDVGLGQGHLTGDRARAHDLGGGADRGPDPHPPGRRGPRWRQPGGLVARHRRPPHPPRDVWGVPSSSVTRLRSPTTPRASSSTTSSRRATRPMRPCSLRPSPASRSSSARCPRRSPPTAAMAKRRWRPSSSPWA